MPFLLLRFRRVILCALLIHFTFHASTQVQEPYDSLDLTGIDFLWPQTWQNMPVPDPLSYADTLSGTTTANLFIRFDKACLDSNAFIGSYEELRDGMTKTVETYHSIPMALLDITYYDFVDSVLTDSKLFLNDGKF